MWDIIMNAKFSRRSFLSFIATILGVAATSACERILPTPTLKPPPTVMPSATPLPTSVATVTMREVATATATATETPEPTATLQPSPTPYVREFSPVRNQKIIGLAHYAPWYVAGAGGGQYKLWQEIPLVVKGSPVQYDSRDQTIIANDIDEATGHGLAFHVGWAGPETYSVGFPRSGVPDGYLDATLKHFILKSPFANVENGFKFIISYESIIRLQPSRDSSGNFIFFDDEDGPRRLQLLLDDVRYIADNYFKHPCYLWMNGKHGKAPVVWFYVSGAWGPNSNQVLRQLRDILEREKGFGIYIIDGSMFWGEPQYPEWWKERSQYIDATAMYAPYEPNKVQNPRKFIDEVVRLCELWKSFTEKLGIHLVPSLMPGYNDRLARPQANNPVLPRDPGWYEELCERVLPFSDGMMFFTSFNELYENTQHTRTVESGDKFLKIVKKTVT